MDTYLEETQNIGHHYGDDRKGSSHNTSHRLVRHKYRWLAVLAFVFAHILWDGRKKSQ